MRLVIAAVCLAFAAMPAYAQDKKDKEPTAAQKKQQTRMKECNERAGDKKGDERKKCMSACLKGGSSAPTAPPESSSITQEARAAKGVAVVVGNRPRRIEGEAASARGLFRPPRGAARGARGTLAAARCTRLHAAPAARSSLHRACARRVLA